MYVSEKKGINPLTLFAYCSKLEYKMPTGRKVERMTKAKAQVIIICVDCGKSIKFVAAYGKKGDKHCQTCRNTRIYRGGTK